MKYVAIIVKAGNGYSAYLPDLPGCIAAGDTLSETEELIRQGAAYHLELMADGGEAIPEPASTAIEVDALVPDAVGKLPADAPR